MTGKGWAALAVAYNIILVLVWHMTGFGWTSLLVGFLLEIICVLVIFIYHIVPRWPG